MKSDGAVRGVATGHHCDAKFGRRVEGGGVIRFAPAHPMEARPFQSLEVLRSWSHCKSVAPGWGVTSNPVALMMF